MAGSTSGITNQAGGLAGSFVGGGPAPIMDMRARRPDERGLDPRYSQMPIQPKRGDELPFGATTPNAKLGNNMPILPPHLQQEIDRRNGVSPEMPQPMPAPMPAPMPQQAPQYDVNTAAAQGLQAAQMGASAEMGYKPMAVSGGGYRPAQASPTGYTAAGASSQGYDAAQAIGQGYDASGLSGQGYTAAQSGAAPTLNANQVAGGQIAGTDLQAYMNPYEDQVVQQSLADIERSRLMQQNIGGAQAGAANAFGGSRQGVAEAETNRAFADQAARTASGLRQSGYQNAQQMAGQDIAIGMQASLANQGANLQAGTTSAQLAQQRALQNQSALNQAGQFGAGAANQAAAQASQQQQAASQFGASAANQAALQNQSALNQAGQFGASASNQMALQNQNALNQARQYGAGATNQASLANQGALNQASQFGASQNMQAQLANQQAGLSGSQQRLQAGSQLGNLSNLGFGMGQTIQNRMDQQGSQQQALQQQLINAAKQQYAGYTGAPADSLQYLLQAVGAAPAVGSQTSGYTPGLFDYLSLGASAIGGR